MEWKFWKSYLFITSNSFKLVQHIYIYLRLIIDLLNDRFHRPMGYDWKIIADINKLFNLMFFSTEHVIYIWCILRKKSQTNSKNKNCVFCWIPCLYKYHYFCKVARHSYPLLTHRICPKILLYTGTESCPSNRYSDPHSCMDYLHNHWHLKR